MIAVRGVDVDVEGEGARRRLRVDVREDDAEPLVLDALEVEPEPLLVHRAALLQLTQLLLVLQVVPLVRVLTLPQQHPLLLEIAGELLLLGRQRRQDPRQPLQLALQLLPALLLLARALPQLLLCSCYLG